MNKYRLVAENKDAVFIIWEGKKAPTNGNAYAALFEAEAHGFIFPVAKAYKGRKFLKDFKATELNKLIKLRFITK
jgi:hypothetical protein